MAKRFIDTGLFDDPWFMDLSKDAKIAWVYLVTKCDHAGIIQINEKLFKVMTGVNSLGTVQQELNGRLIQLRDSYYFIPKFINYQYPGFPKSNVNQQSGAIKRLQEFGLYFDGNLTLNQDFTNSSSTVHEELTNSYGYGNGNGNGNGIEKGGVGEKTKTWRNDFNIYLDDLIIAYRTLLSDSDFISKQESYYPGIDIQKTLEKAYNEYWSTEAAWIHKKKSRAHEINWKTTLTNALTIGSNKVYKSRSTITPPEKRLTAADFMKS